MELALVTTPIEPTHRKDPSSPVEILAFIDVHIGERDLTPARISAEFELPRTSLYRMLEPYGGVRALIQARRLDRIAQVLLTSSVGPTELKPVAIRHGFVSVPHFSRTFTQRFGMTPSRYIARARSNDRAWIREQRTRIGALMAMPTGA